MSFDLTKPGQMFGRLEYPKDADLSSTGVHRQYPRRHVGRTALGAPFDLPIIITENGVEDDKDTSVRAIPVEHLHQVWRAANLQLAGQGLLPLVAGG